MVLQKHIIHPGHSAIRSKLRVIGPTLPMVGGGMFLCAFFGIATGIRPLFFLGFFAVPILFVGGCCTGYGFIGALALAVKKTTPTPRFVTSVELHWVDD